MQTVNWSRLVSLDSPTADLIFFKFARNCDSEIMKIRCTVLCILAHRTRVTNFMRTGEKLQQQQFEES